MGGAEADRSLEIGAHAHAETRETALARKFLQQGKMKRRLFMDRRNAHQSDDRQVEVLSAAADELQRVFRRDTRLLTFLSRVHLDKEPRRLSARLLIELGLQGFRQAQPVEGMDRVEKLERIAHFVRL